MGIITNEGFRTLLKAAVDNMADDLHRQLDRMDLNDVNGLTIEATSMLERQTAGTQRTLLLLNDKEEEATIKALDYYLRYNPDADAYATHVMRRLVK